MEISNDELLELYWEEYPDRGPPDAQQLHDFFLKLNPKVSPDVSAEQVEALMQSNAETFSKTSSDFTLVDRVMQRHGLTRKQAEEQIRLFGG